MLFNLVQLNVNFVEEEFILLASFIYAFKVLKDILVDVKFLLMQLKLLE